MPVTSFFDMSLESREDNFMLAGIPPALRAAFSHSSLSQTSGERANKASISSRVFPVTVDNSQCYAIRRAVKRGMGLTLGAQEVDVGCSEEAAQQGPDEDPGSDSVDAGATSKDHDESREPFTCSSKTASNVTVFQWRDLRTVHPAGTEPAESKYDLVKNNDCDSSPVCTDRRFTSRQCCEDHIDEHADTTSKSRPENNSVSMLNFRKVGSLLQILTRSSWHDDRPSQCTK
jgi:hypothetical protein